MLMPGRHYNADKYRFGFNGKEHDTEWKNTPGAIYDYGFRIYDPRIAKFLSVDPLTMSYPWYTPYQFAGNMPIAAYDLDGLEEKWAINEEKGTSTLIQKMGHEDILFIGQVDDDGALIGKVHTTSGSFHGWSKEGYVVSNVNLWENVPEYVDLGDVSVFDLKIRYVINNSKSRILKIALAHYDANGGVDEFGYKSLSTINWVDEYVKIFGTNSSLFAAVQLGYFSPDGSFSGPLESGAMGGKSAVEKFTRAIAQKRQINQATRKVARNLRQQVKQAGKSKKQLKQEIRQQKALPAPRPLKALLPAAKDRNPWNKFLKYNRGKYKGKDWMQRARSDYYSNKFGL